jgi:hypothetical protein
MVVSHRASSREDTSTQEQRDLVRRHLCTARRPPVEPRGQAGCYPWYLAVMAAINAFMTGSHNVDPQVRGLCAKGYQPQDSLVMK